MPRSTTRIGAMAQKESNSREFPLLADPHRYVACPLDLGKFDGARDYWIGLFREHIQRVREQVGKQQGHDSGLERRLESFTRHFNDYLDRIQQAPDQFGRLDILRICWARERALRHGGISDAYRDVKIRENEASLALLPSLLMELDGCSPQQRSRRMIEGVLAGNIFDLGATKTGDLFKDRSVDFQATLRMLRPRPWLIDDLDVWLGRWHRRPHRSAVMFVDNAGCDIVLGMIPFARELMKRGTQVLLTANTDPSLNDVTHDELADLVQRVASVDAAIRDALHDGRLELVASGNGVPLIDLSCISPELYKAVIRRKVDLVVLEGMGRAIESNYEACFKCDALKIAMIKDPSVAEQLGGELYDLVFRYEPWSCDDG